MMCSVGDLVKSAIENSSWATAENEAATIQMIRSASLLIGVLRVKLQIPRRLKAASG